MADTHSPLFPHSTGNTPTQPTYRLSLQLTQPARSTQLPLATLPTQSTLPSQLPTLPTQPTQGSLRHSPLSLYTASTATLRTQLHTGPTADTARPPHSSTGNTAYTAYTGPTADTARSLYTQLPPATLLTQPTCSHSLATLLLQPSYRSQLTRQPASCSTQLPSVKRRTKNRTKTLTTSFWSR
jgi:hypothetical protein